MFGPKKIFIFFFSCSEFRTSFLDSDPHPMLFETWNYQHLFILFQESFFDLLFEKQAFIFGVTTMEEAMSRILHLCYVLMTTRRRCSSYWAPNKVKVTWDPRMKFWTAGFLVASNSFDSLFTYRNVWIYSFVYVFQLNANLKENNTPVISWKCDSIVSYCIDNFKESLTVKNFSL